MCSGTTENTQKVLRVKMTKHRVFRQETLSAVTMPVVGDMVLRAIVFVLADMALSSGFPERLGQGNGCHLSAACPGACHQHECTSFFFSPCQVFPPPNPDLGTTREGDCAESSRG